MKEKLIIRNFGPIKEVELDLRQVNILIGDQGTGKSTIGKLLAIFNDDWFIQEKDFIRLLKGYNIDSFLNSATEINYENEFLRISYLGEIKIEFIDLKLEKLVESIRFARDKWRGSDNELLLDELIKIRGEFAKQYFVSKYIPSERTIIGSNDEVLNLKENSKDAEFEYISQFEKDFRRSKVNNKLNFLNNDFVKEGNVWVQIKDGKKIRLKVASSGIQSAFPLALTFTSNLQIFQRVYHVIEEPEQNLFPASQNELIKFLIVCSDLNQDKLLVTTHSPYILTSINNLMYAFEVGLNNPEKTNEVIPKEYWINPEYVSAYRLLPDGSCRNIIETTEDGTLITAEEIDEVSSVLNKEFNDLINIELGVENEEA